MSTERRQTITVWILEKEVVDGGTPASPSNTNKLTYFGSRMVVGGVYGSLLGFFSALINLSPHSILATGAVAAGVAFGLRVLMCAKVALDFVFLSRHEMNENRLYHKDNFVNRPIRERLARNTESSRYIPMPDIVNPAGSRARLISVLLMCSYLTGITLGFAQ